MTKAELFSLIADNSKPLQDFGVKRLGIFGSFVKGEVKDSSDVDFLIEIEKDFKTLKNLIGLSRYLSSLTGRKVEIVTPQSLNPFTGKHILNEVEYVPIAA